MRNRFNDCLNVFLFVLLLLLLIFSLSRDIFSGKTTIGRGVKGCVGGWLMVDKSG